MRRRARPRARAGSPSGFPGSLANDHVDFDLRRGEVHALLGENGAGKSTLMNVLYGLYRPDEGEIRVDGQPVTFALAHATRSTAGIGMVHQHFMLIPVMTVAENIVLGDRSRSERRRLPRLRQQRERACERSRERSASLSTRTRSSQDITVGQQQRVEILKALYRRADILILDEPTAVLTPQEAHGALRDPAEPHARGDVDHLHHPQAERGARDRRPDHRAAARAR